MSQEKRKAEIGKAEIQANSQNVAAVATGSRAPERSGRAASDEMLTKEELAPRMKVSVRTIEQWQHDGHLPFLKLGQVVLFYWPEVVRHLTAQFTVNRSLPTATNSTEAGRTGQ